MLNERPRKLMESVPRPLRIFLAVFILYTAVTWISCLIHYRMGHSKPYSSPFIHQSWDPYTDFRTYNVRFLLYFHRAEFFKHYAEIQLPYFSYPAPAAVVYRFFYGLHRPTRDYLLLGGVWALLLTLGLFAYLRRAGSKKGVAAGIALLMLAGSFPLDFMLERGNLELVVWILVYLGVFLYLKRYDKTAAVLLGAAASMKIYPIIFCGLLLQRRRYGALGVAILTAAVCDVLSLWYAGPTFMTAFHGFNQTVMNYQQSYSIPARVSDGGMDHSFFSATKAVGQQLGLHYQTWLHPYYAMAGVLALVLFFGRSLRLPLFNQGLFIMIMAISLPPNSFDYTFVYLYLPWAMLSMVAFQATRRGVAVPGLTPMLLCFVPLFAPFSLFVRHDMRFGGHVQTVVLLVLLFLCLRCPVADELWMRLGQDRRTSQKDSLAPLPSVQTA